MPTARLTLPAGWPASPTFTASGGSLAVLVRNTEGNSVYWWVTSDDTAPTASVGDGHEIEAGASQGITLGDGERLWIAARGEGMSITATDGAE